MRSVPVAGRDAQVVAVRAATIVPGAARRRGSARRRATRSRMSRWPSEERERVRPRMQAANQVVNARAPAATSRSAPSSFVSRCA